MKNVVAYCRVSTDKDSQFDSFEAQKKYFVDYAKKNNLNLLRIYADRGITGTSTKKRAEFNEMMQDSKKGIFDCVLVKDVSRLARNILDFVDCIRKLKARDINVKFVNSDIDTLDDNDSMLLMSGLMAEEESRNMSKRIKFGKRINAEKGRVPNLCYGYIKINGDKFNLKINKEEAEIVKEIFDLYVNKGHGTQKISEILNDRGLKSLRGVDWSTTSVSRILQNKIYAGYVINGKTEIKNFIEKTRRIKDESEWFEVRNENLEIIPLELWEKAQNINKFNNIKSEKTIHKKRSNKHLFSTLITCDCCGYSFRRVQNKRKDYIRTYWCCSGRNRYGTKYCRNTTIIMENELIENIDNYFLSMIKDKKKFVDNIMSKYQKKQPENSGTELNRQLEKLQKKKQKQKQMYENDIIEIEELKECITDIDRQIAQIRLQLDVIETPQNIEKKLKQLYHELWKNFEKYSSVANMTNAELKMLIKSITADENGNINIELNY